MAGAPAADECVSRCQGIEGAAATISMRGLQVGGSEFNTAGESPESKGNCVVLPLEGFLCSLVNLARNSHDAHSCVRIIVVLEGADRIVSLCTHVLSVFYLVLAIYTLRKKYSY